ncbi:MAG: type restriction m6 adenine methyltransferase, Alw26I/Eco31I/Esp3I family [Acidobacteria bacterium]|nr:type restriction m6 adenine methyltransferase, Alw26I/Eco31I/Esp3I family [Acidobacteriota bacterium]
MPEGVSGSLVSDYFLEDALQREFAGELGESGRDAARSACRLWWRETARAMGPVTPARAVFDLAAVPLARILGFEAPSPGGGSETGVLVAELRRPEAGGRAGSVDDARARMPLVAATAWGDNLSSTWRRAVRETLAAGTTWCVCTNGRLLRLTDARHSCAQRYVEFDLEAVCGDAASFAIFWALLRREAFDSRRGDTSAGLAPLHEQALTIVYRALFLLFAESRGLVPTWHPIYRRSYSMEAARAIAESSGPARGLWEALQAMWRLAHAGCRAGTLRVTPFNGRLFAPALTPAGESGRPGDECARRMLLALTTAPGRGGAARARIAYRDLGVEQLGSVYEAVLDYRPVMTAVGPSSAGPAAKPCNGACPAEAAKPRRRVRLVPGSGLRKATGTFYTPSAITNFLVRRALSPLVSEAAPERILALRVLDPAMGSGAFLVAACRYLAGAYEEALVGGGGCHPSDIGDAERRSFRRLVAQQCLYGVDLNPMAVQLARLSLWLATLAPDRPLTFLDHRLLAGNSLLGASLDDLARRPFPCLARAARRRADGPLPLFAEEDAGQALRATLPVRLRVASTPDDTLGTVREKERLLASVAGAGSPLAPWKHLADAWCALAYGLDSGRHAPPSLFPALADRLAGRHCALPPAEADRWLAEAEATARAHQFFHYSLEFPEVFFDEAGRPRADGGFDAVLGNPPWDMVRNDNAGAMPGGRAARLVRFARGSGVYRALSGGHPNLFQLFVERAVGLVRPGGRIGLVTPAGLLTDCGSAPVRRLLFDRSAIDALVAFDNTRRIFPIHRSVRFAVFTATAGASTGRLPCRPGERDPSALDRIPDAGGGEHFPLSLTRSLLERVSGDDLAVPDVRQPADVDLLETLTAAAPALGAPSGWNARFGRELNATDDRALFWDGGDGMPVVEGKHVRPFRVILPGRGLRVRPGVEVGLGARAAWFARARLAYRDVACATNRLTCIAAIVPAGHATVHTLFCLKTPLDEESQWFLCGMLNSLVVNYLVRLQVATHVTTAIMARLPVPRPPAGSPSLRAVASLARGLAASPDPERDPRYGELQALAARLYGLDAPQLEHVLAGFPLIGPPTKERVREAWRGGGVEPRGGSMG